VILYAVFFYVRYGVSVNHATLNRWVVRYSPFIADEAKKRKQSVAGSWRMDETYIKVKGQWTYLYRAIDKYGSTVDFMLSEHRDEVAATAFFKQAIDHNGLPSNVVIDKSGANNAGLENINILIFLSGLLYFIDILKVKYLNNIIEQDDRFIKKITKPMMGFKAFHSAGATLAGIETADMIRKGQFANNQLPAYQQFIALAV
jgi:putative transposase